MKRRLIVPEYDADSLQEITVIQRRENNKFVTEHIAFIFVDADTYPIGRPGIHTHAHTRANTHTYCTHRNSEMHTSTHG